MGIDVGGSGLRLRRVLDDRLGPVRTAPGARVTTDGIDLDALVTSAERLLSDVRDVHRDHGDHGDHDVHGDQDHDPGGPAARTVRPDVLVWSMRGLLGLLDPETVHRTVARRLGAARTVVCSDALSSLVGGVGAVRPGAVVAAGTGAVAFGTDFTDVWRRVDGWGHVLGDRGSGAWVGLEGLRAALRTSDGVSDGTSDEVSDPKTGHGGALLAAALAHFGPVEGWPRMVMTRSDAPELLAGFAPSVAGLAGQDPTAAAICAAAGRALAASLASAAAGLEDGRLVAVGGLLRAASVRRAFEAACAEAGLTLTPARGTSLDGALLLARHLASGRPLPGRPPYLLVG